MGVYLLMIRFDHIALGCVTCIVYRHCANILYIQIRLLLIDFRPDLYIALLVGNLACCPSMMTGSFFGKGLSRRTKVPSHETWKISYVIKKGITLKFFILLLNSRKKYPLHSPIHSDLACTQSTSNCSEFIQISIFQNI